MDTCTYDKRCSVEPTTAFTHYALTLALAFATQTTTTSTHIQTNERTNERWHIPSAVEQQLFDTRAKHVQARVHWRFVCICCCPVFASRGCYSFASMVCWCVAVAVAYTHGCYWLKIKIQKNQLIGVAHAVCCTFTPYRFVCYCVKWYCYYLKIQDSIQILFRDFCVLLHFVFDFQVWFVSFVDLHSIIRAESRQLAFGLEKGILNKKQPTMWPIK